MKNKTISSGNSLLVFCQCHVHIDSTLPILLELIFRTHGQLYYHAKCAEHKVSQKIEKSHYVLIG